MARVIAADAGKGLARWQIALLAILPLLGFWATGLFDLDEGFYAAVVSEMIYRRDWITPYYNGAPWFEKPILLYWLAIPSVALFGEMVGPRLPSVLCTLGIYYALWAFVRRYVNEQAAGLTVLLCAGSLLMVVVGRLMMTDLPLVLAEVLAFLCFWRGLHDGAKWKVLAAFWLGLSVLAKGPVGCAFFVMIAGLTYWREPHLRPAFRGGWLAGTAVFLAVVASWYVPAYVINGQVFVQEFLIEQNVKRFAGGDEAHTVRGFWGLIQYVPILLLGAAPWIFSLFRAWPRGRDQSTEATFLRYCARWGWVIFLFFTISAAKLPHYILPVIPAFAIVVGAYAAREWQARGHAALDGRVARGPIIGILVVTLFVNWGVWTYYSTATFFGRTVAAPHSHIHQLTRWARATGLPIAAFQMPRRQRELGTGSAEVQETSHPSIVFYAGKPINKAETLEDLLKPNTEQIVLTRTGRISAQVIDDALARGAILTPIAEAPNTRFYEAWRVRPLNPATTSSP